MQIHPSVIMNISEHHTRTLAIRQQPGIVVGALLGKKIDHNSEIVDSFELRVIGPNAEGDINYTIDREFYMKKLPLVKQVFPDLDLIGWYCTSLPNDTTPTTETDVILHKQISEIIVNPIFLKLNPYKRENDPKISGCLPLNVYEAVINIDSRGENPNFIEVSSTIVTEDVEIIGLEHNAKVTHVNVTPSAAIDNLRLQYSAVKMLKDRIKLVTKFVRDVHSGVLEYHEETVADIAKLCKQFPIMRCENYTQAYNVQCNDVALNTYLGILTKGSMCKLHFGVPSSKTRAFSTTHARR